MHDGHEGHAGHHHHHHDLEATSASREEAVALLGYMVAHNEHHAEELTELAENMRGLGLADAAEEIENSVADFKEGDVPFLLLLPLLQLTKI